MFDLCEPNPKSKNSSVAHNLQFLGAQFTVRFNLLCKVDFFKYRHECICFDLIKLSSFVYSLSPTLDIAHLNIVRNKAAAMYYEKRYIIIM